MKTVHPERVNIRLLCFWGSFGMSLFVVWLHSMHASHQNVWARCLSYVIGLGIIFVLEGIELAYTDLRDKDEAQLEPMARELLVAIKANEGLFYELREWAAVAVIGCITYLSDMEVIAIPLAGEHTDWPWRFGFVICMTSLPVLWFAQSPAKFLATRNSEAFLTIASEVPFWRRVGLLARASQATGVFELSMALRAGLTRIRRFSTARNLPPSDTAFFVNAIKHYGYGLYALDEHKTLREDGGGDLKQRVLFYFAGGSRFEVVQHFTLSGVSGSQEVISCHCFASPPLGESIEDLEPELDRLWRGEAPGDGFEEIFQPSFRKLFTRSDDGLTFKLHSPVALPHGIVTAGRRRAEAVVVLLDIHLSIMPGSPPADEVFYYKEFTLPCRLYSISVDCERGQLARATPRVCFHSTDHQRECAKVMDSTTLDKSGWRCDVRYPLPGATYRWDWQVWRDQPNGSDNIAGVNSAVTGGL